MLASSATAQTGRGVAVVREAERHAQFCCQVTSNAGHRHGVGAVGIDFEVPQYVFGDTKRIVDGSTQCGIGLTGEQHDAITIFAQADLTCRAAHAVRHLAAHLALRNLHAVGHGGADRGERNQVADRHVERAAAHL